MALIFFINLLEQQNHQRGPQRQEHQRQSHRLIRRLIPQLGIHGEPAQLVHGELRVQVVTENSMLFLERATSKI